MPNRLQTYLAKFVNFASGVAICSAFLLSTGIANAEETIIEKPKSYKPKTRVVHPDNFSKIKSRYTKFLEDTAENIIDKFPKISLKELKSLLIQTSEEVGVGDAYKSYSIDLEEIVKQSHKDAQPGAISKFFSSLGSTKHKNTGSILGFSTEYHQEMPEESDYEDDLEEDYENSLYCRYLGDEKSSAFFKLRSLSEEDKNSRSEWELSIDGLISRTFGKSKDSSFFSLSPIFKLGTHVIQSGGTLEFTFKLGDGWEIAAQGYGNFYWGDDLFKTDGWVDASTYKWVKRDLKNIVSQGEIALELSKEDKDKNRYRLCLFAFYRDQDVLQGYEKDYAGAITTQNYRYDLDFFEEETTARIAFMIDPENTKGVFLKVYGRYSKVKEREIFDNQNPPASSYNKVTYKEEGAVRVMCKFPLEDPDNKREFISQASIILGGERDKHYGFLSLMFEEGSFEEQSLLINETEEPMRVELYTKRNKYFRESLGGRGTFHGFKIGYQSLAADDGERAKLFLYIGYKGIWDFKNLVVKTNIGYYQDIATSKQPFDLETSLELQFRTNNNHIIGIKGSFGIESDKFNSHRERELDGKISIFWSF